MDPTIKDFESAIAELETIVKTLEEEISRSRVARALRARVQLSRFCHAKLEEAERRVEILSERGEISPAPATLAGEGAPGDRGR